jgi:TolB-like protein
LPLKNLTGDQTNDYFSDGITESLISSLSRVENLTVQSRSSVFRFKNKDIDPREVGKQLGVAAVLEGSVRNVSDSVSVTVQLVSVADGRVLWTSDEHERALGDVVKLQDEISRNVASSLRLQLSPDAQGRIARRYTTDPQAFHLYLQGRFWLTNYSVPNDLNRAAKYFESATKKDPDYALAYTGLADTYLNMAIDWANPKEVMPIAQANAQKAMQLDPELGEAHYSTGALAYFYEWNRNWNKRWI